MDRSLERFSKRDKAIFRRIVKSYATHDKLRANVLANELAEIRKVEKDKFEAEPSLKDLQGRLRKLQTETADLLLQAKKLEKTARKRARSLKKEIKALRKKVKYLRELLGSLNS